MPDIRSRARHPWLRWRCGPWPLHRRRFPPPLGSGTLALTTALFVTAIDNRALWSAIGHAADIGVGRNLGFALATVALVTAFFTLVLSLFACCHYLFKPFLILFLLAAAANGYFMDVYGIVIDDTMLRNVVQTDAGEAGELLGPGLFTRVLFAGVLPGVLVALTPLRRAPLWREMLIRIATPLICLIVVAGALASHYKDFALLVRNNRELRYLVNPTYPMWAFSQYAIASADADDGAVKPLGTDAVRRESAVAAGRRSAVVLVVGETARADHFALNGYERDTNPELASLPGVVSFGDVSACGTSTAVSLPCMFSVLDRDTYDHDRAAATENLLDVLVRAGVEVWWLENNSGCKGVCERVPTRRPDRAAPPGLCPGGDCFDEVLLDGLDRRLNAADGDVLIVLHQQGSHGPAYSRRYPARFRRFLPQCTSNTPQDCPRAAIVNSYDNSILYTDHVLARVIEVLQRHDAEYDGALLYLSDHGESLGENGIYLHGFPYALAPRAQTRVPLLLWLSPSFRTAAGLDLGCIEARTGESLSHDNLFDTVLGLFSVHTRVYRPARDILRSCRRAGADISSP